MPEIDADSNTALLDIPKIEKSGELLDRAQGKCDHAAGEGRVFEFQSLDAALYRSLRSTREKGKVHQNMEGPELR